jgi:simple sugar transport system ATP-binding protein
VPPAEAQGVLTARGVQKAYGAVRALENGVIEVRPGAITALVGDNGAGKSTFVKILSGVLRPDGGELEIDGAECPFFASARDAQAAGVMTVYQDLALVETLAVVENMFLGRELCVGPFRRRGEMLRLAKGLLAEMAVDIPDPSIRVERLSGGQRQGVAFARAINARGRFFLLDEPTAATGVRETREIVQLIGGLRDRGAGILLVSHDIPLVVELADRIFVLRQGSLATTLERGASLDDIVLAIAR